MNENVSSSKNFDHRPLKAPSTLMFVNDFSKIFPVYKQARMKASLFFGWQGSKNLIPASDNLRECWWQNVLKQSITLGHAQPPHIVGQDETTNLVIKSCAGWSSQLFNQKGSFNTVPNVRIDVEIKCIFSPAHKINVCGLTESWESTHKFQPWSANLSSLCPEDRSSCTNEHQEKPFLKCVCGEALG